MSNQVIIHENYALLPGNGRAVLITGAGGSYNNVMYKGGVAGSTPIVRDYQAEALGFAPWGRMNNFPQKVIEMVSKSSIIAPTLDKKVCMAQGQSVLPVELDWDDQGKQKFTVVKDPEIFQFLWHPSTEKYINEALTDLFWFYNVFPRLTFSVNHTKILKIETEEAPFCRWGLQNEYGYCDNLYVNANWPRAFIDDPLTQTFKAINPYAYNLVLEAKKLKNEDSFIYPVSYPTPGKTYYQLAHWDGIRESGWMQVIEAIPNFKKHMLEHQSVLQFHIELPDYYFDQKLGAAYTKATEPEKLAMRTKEMQTWNDILTGAKNAGKSIASIFKTINNGKDKVQGVTITPIDNKLKEGMLVDDNQEAMSNLLYALGVDPTLLGFAPGSKMGAGAGSDKREAFLIFLATVDPYRRKILEPLNFIAEYNGWKNKYPFLRFMFQDTILTTLDKGKSAEQTLNTGKGNI